MSTPIILNARIDTTFLGVEGHGVFTFSLDVQYHEVTHQGFGGYFLDAPVTGANLPARTGKVYGMTMIMEVLRVLAVPSWEKLPGTPCRVRIEQGLIVAIGHFMKEQWLEPQKLYAALVEAGLEKG